MKSRWGIALLIIVMLAITAAATSPDTKVTAQTNLDESYAVNPATPAAEAENLEFVSSLGGGSRGVAVQGNYAYVGEGRRLIIFDISNPDAPVVVGKTPRMPRRVSDVAVAGDYAYVTNGDGILRIVNVANRSAPVSYTHLDVYKRQLST